MTVLRTFLILFLIFLPAQVNAQAGGHSWTVAKIKGIAFIARKGLKAAKVRRGMLLRPPGQTLSTRTRTRVSLIRGKERIQVGPGAIMALPPAKYNKPGKTLILHQSGRLDLSVNKRDVKHFSVKTPYLVAVVKGTNFWVDVREGGRSDVHVNSGSVEVADNSSGHTADITRGQSVSVAKVANGKREMRFRSAGKKN